MWLRYLLDTDTCSYIMKRHPPSVRERLQQIPIGSVGRSSVTLAELRYGIERLHSSRFTHEDLDFFVRHLTIKPWDALAADHYAKIRVKLEREGTPIGNMDMMIAAHARSLGVVLVTNNTRHFSRVEGLVWENWVAE